MRSRSSMIMVVPRKRPRYRADARMGSGSGTIGHGQPDCLARAARARWRVLCGHCDPP